MIDAVIEPDESMDRPKKFDVNTILRIADNIIKEDSLETTVDSFWAQDILDQASEDFGEQLNELTIQEMKEYIRNELNPGHFETRLADKNRSAEE